MGDDIRSLELDVRPEVAEFATVIWLSTRKARKGDGAATGEQFVNLKTCQNGNLILINQVKLYKDKRLQRFCYQGLPRKQIHFVKHYLLSDLQK
ncbi:MAG: hypothetical protein V7L20_27695 [Nostoc sp.]|uniref:hypothetical protein n=1 Tax=Nostoc sp. TaxID=1180 RepID=UPI002FF6B518